MSIKYGKDDNFLKFYGTQTLKQALIDKNLIGPANIDEYFAMFLQGYVDEYDEKTDVFGEKNIQDVLAETKRKIDDYDNYNIKHAISQLYGTSPPRPYKVYKLYKDMERYSSGLNLTAPLESKDTFINMLRTIKESIVIIGEISNKITIPGIKEKLNRKIVFFNEKISHSTGDTKKSYQHHKGHNNLRPDLVTLLNENDGFVAILNDYYKDSIGLFITVHQTFYNYLDEYFGNKKWSNDSDKAGIWKPHPNYKKFWLAQSYVNYVEHIGTSINLDFLNINKNTNTTSAGKKFEKPYIIPKDDIDGINEKVLFYLELEEQISKIINIYNVLTKENNINIPDISNKYGTIDANYNDITIKNIIEINIKGILMLKEEQLNELKEVVESSTDTKKLFKVYRHFLQNIVNSYGGTVIAENNESMQNYKDIFIENVKKGDGERYTNYM